MNLTGKLLISMPSLEDERFYKTVIYMCAHSSEGAMGIITVSYTHLRAHETS